MLCSQPEWVRGEFLQSWQYKTAVGCLMQAFSCTGHAGRWQTHMPPQLLCGVQDLQNCPEAAQAGVLYRRTAPVLHKLHTGTVSASPPSPESQGRKSGCSSMHGTSWRDSTQSSPLSSWGPLVQRSPEQFFHCF